MGVQDSFELLKRFALVVLNRLKLRLGIFDQIYEALFLVWDAGSSVSSGDLGHLSLSLLLIVVESNFVLTRISYGFLTSFLKVAAAISLLRQILSLTSFSLIYEVHFLVLLQNSLLEV